VLAPLFRVPSSHYFMPTPYRPLFSPEGHSETFPFNLIITYTVILWHIGPVLWIQHSTAGSSGQWQVPNYYKKVCNRVYKVGAKNDQTFRDFTPNVRGFTPCKFNLFCCQKNQNFFSSSEVIWNFISSPVDH
jgi:hypothetical protein